MTTQFDYTISLISEWADKGNAFDYVQDTRVDPRPLLVDIASGLRYLHSRAIIHGDLRGHNVMISGDGRAMITDYGVSSLVDAEFDQNAAISMPGGQSIRWMPPETMENFEEVSARGDIWTFGMTVLELFTRKVPFHNVTGLRAVIGRILDGQPDKPSDPATCYRMTDAWWNVCCRCWARDPWRRPCMPDVVKIIERIWYVVPSPKSSMPDIPVRFTRSYPFFLDTCCHRTSVASYMQIFLLPDVLHHESLSVRYSSCWYTIFAIVVWLSVLTCLFIFLVGLFGP
ncbi:hypothetical protein PISMIDRAFT_647625 [Pisolithus microcarpus 441]|uniref:Protein kinase domain-containing protein n=1 Tax=Pisolithus microcarpus 441 TaxID=765257 RepID=A0A0C9ZMT8_9AGAM|nr:hypothetical protein PISMIDRAFT_647625 [Pisolithus microcarpus 441]